MTAWTLQALLELRVEVNVVRKGYSGRSPARTTWCTFWVMQGMKALRIICVCGRFVVSCQRMTSCRIWLEIAILRRSEETCQAREFIVLSVEQSVRDQIVCGHHLRFTRSHGFLRAQRFAATWSVYTLLGRASRGDQRQRP